MKKRPTLIKSFVILIILNFKFLFFIFLSFKHILELDRGISETTALTLKHGDHINSNDLMSKL